MSFVYWERHLRKVPRRKFMLVTNHVISWERASEAVCTKAIGELGSCTDLYRQAAKYTPLVDAIVKRLKNGEI